jgi:hypothetical protein
VVHLAQSHHQVHGHTPKPFWYKVPTERDLSAVFSGFFKIKPLDFLLSYGIVLQSLRRLIWVDLTRENVVQSKLSGENIFHKMDGALYIFRVQIMIQGIYVNVS